MQIKMVGIDHNMAALKYREAFSFGREESVAAMKKIVETSGVDGCIIIATCNRTEMWISCDETIEKSPGELLCEVKEVSYDSFKEFFVDRKGKDAIEHLMVTACGINSRVFGEDQIIAQIKDALELSRKSGCTSRTLEKVFQNSITAAKKVKTSIKLSGYNPSVATSGVKELTLEYGSLKDKKCLIIGNGKMSALIAEHLMSQGADVMMTLRRKYHHGEEFESLIPKGCEMIPYEERYKAIPRADIVISATLSPHYTVTVKGLKDVLVKEPGVWLDLAVPRDLEPAISENYNVKICDIDGLESQVDTELFKDELIKAGQIIGTYRDDILNWLEFRKLVPSAKKIISLTREDAVLRADKELKDLNLGRENTEKIEKIMGDATARAINKLIFGLKETLPKEQWDKCINGILKAAEKDTLKS